MKSQLNLLVRHYLAKAAEADHKKQQLLELAKSSGKEILEHPLTIEVGKLEEYLVGLSDAAELIGVGEAFGSLIVETK